MSLDPVVLGFLGRALSFEFSAIQQYLALSKLLLTKGFIDESNRFKNEAQEEMVHAEKIITRLIGFGCAPNATQLRPAMLNGSIVQVLQSTRQLEKEIVQLYEQAVVYCNSNNDVENKMFFDSLYKEEQHHYLEIDTLVKSMINGTNVDFN